jgi:hypothetical protein
MVRKTANRTASTAKATVSSSSSFASPTSILKLNDSLHGSSHSSSSTFSVRDNSKSKAALHADILLLGVEGGALGSGSLPLLPFGNSTTTITKKSVSFSWHVEKHEILHRNDMDENEKIDRWYRKKEWKTLRREGRVTSRLMQNGDLTSNHEDLGFCTLGLKKETHPYANQNQLHKFLYKDLLMSEQQRQYDLGINDADILAEKLIQLNRKSRHAVFISSLNRSGNERILHAQSRICRDQHTYQ